MMLASNGNVKLDAERISLQGPYVDFLAGGRIRILSGTKEVGEKATASIELAAAYFSIIAEEKVISVLAGRIGDNTFCLIQDEPEKVVNKGALIRNVVIGLAVTVVVAALCVFALPVALGAIGVAAATASTIAMGAAVGAAATGTIVMVEQYRSDKKMEKLLNGRMYYLIH